MAPESKQPSYQLTALWQVGDRVRTQDGILRQVIGVKPQTNEVLLTGINGYISGQALILSGGYGSIYI